MPKVSSKKIFKDNPTVSKRIAAKTYCFENNIIQDKDGNLHHAEDLAKTFKDILKNNHQIRITGITEEQKNQICQQLGISPNTIASTPHHLSEETQKILQSINEYNKQLENLKEQRKNNKDDANAIAIARKIHNIQNKIKNSSRSLNNIILISASQDHCKEFNQIGQFAMRVGTNSENTPSKTFLEKVRIHSTPPPVLKSVAGYEESPQEQDLRALETFTIDEIHDGIKNKNKKIHTAMEKFKENSGEIKKTKYSVDDKACEAGGITDQFKETQLEIQRFYNRSVILRQGNKPRNDRLCASKSGATLTKTSNQPLVRGYLAASENYTRVKTNKIGEKYFVGQHAKDYDHLQDGSQKTVDLKTRAKDIQQELKDKTLKLVGGLQSFVDKDGNKREYIILRNPKPPDPNNSEDFIIFVNEGSKFLDGNPIKIDNKTLKKILQGDEEYTVYTIPKCESLDHNNIHYLEEIKVMARIVGLNDIPDKLLNEEEKTLKELIRDKSYLNKPEKQKQLIEYSDSDLSEKEKNEALNILSNKEATIDEIKRLEGLIAKSVKTIGKLCPIAGDIDGFTTCYDAQLPEWALFPVNTFADDLNDKKAAIQTLTDLSEQLIKIYRTQAENNSDAQNSLIYEALKNLNDDQIKTICTNEHALDRAGCISPFEFVNKQLSNYLYNSQDNNVLPMRQEMEDAFTKGTKALTLESTTLDKEAAIVTAMMHFDNSCVEKGIDKHSNLYTKIKQRMIDAVANYKPGHKIEHPYYESYVVNLFQHGDDVRNPYGCDPDGAWALMTHNGKILYGSDQENLIKVLMAKDFLENNPFPLNHGFDMKKWGIVVEKMYEIGHPVPEEVINALHNSRTMALQEAKTIQLINKVESLNQTIQKTQNKTVFSIFKRKKLARVAPDFNADLEAAKQALTEHLNNQNLTTQEHLKQFSKHLQPVPEILCTEYLKNLESKLKERLDALPKHILKLTDPDYFNFTDIITSEAYLDHLNKGGEPLLTNDEIKALSTLCNNAEKFSIDFTLSPKTLELYDQMCKIQLDNIKQIQLDCEEILRDYEKEVEEVKNYSQLAEITNNTIDEIKDVLTTIENYLQPHILDSEVKSIKAKLNNAIEVLKEIENKYQAGLDVTNANTDDQLKSVKNHIENLSQDVNKAHHSDNKRSKSIRHSALLSQEQSQRIALPYQPPRDQSSKFSAKRQTITARRITKSFIDEPKTADRKSPKQKGKASKGSYTPSFREKLKEETPNIRRVSEEISVQENKAKKKPK